MNRLLILVFVITAAVAAAASMLLLHALVWILVVIAVVLGLVAHFARASNLFAWAVGLGAFALGFVCMHLHFPASANVAGVLLAIGLAGIGVGLARAIDHLFGSGASGPMKIARR